MPTNTITVIVTADAGGRRPDDQTKATGSLLRNPPAITVNGSWENNDTGSYLWMLTIDRASIEGIKEQLRVIWTGHGRVTWRHVSEASELITG